MSLASGNRIPKMRIALFFALILSAVAFLWYDFNRASHEVGASINSPDGVYEGRDSPYGPRKRAVALPHRDLPDLQVKVALSPDEKQALSCDVQGLVRLWDVASGKPMMTLDRPPLFGGRRLLGFARDGKLAILMNRPDRMLRGIDLASGTMVIEFDACQLSWPTCIGLTSDGTGLLVGSADGANSLVLTTPSQQLAAPVAMDSAPPLPASFAERSDSLPDFARLKYFDTSMSGQAETWIESPKCIFHGVVLSDDKRRALLVHESVAGVEWQIWDMTTRKKTHLLGMPQNSPPDSPVHLAACAGFSRDGKLFAAIFSHRVHLWNADTGNWVKSLEGSVRWHYGSVVFSPDSKLVFVSAEGVVREEHRHSRIWDLETGEVKTHLHEAPEPVLSAEFFKDGKRILTSGAGGLKIWDVETGKITRDLNLVDSLHN